jgi:hypothetical protein
MEGKGIKYAHLAERIDPSSESKSNSLYVSVSEFFFALDEIFSKALDKSDMRLSQLVLHAQLKHLQDAERRLDKLIEQIAGTK